MRIYTKESADKMKQKDIAYWYDQLDRFGLIFGGMFIGALMELTGIRTLGIIVSVSLLTSTCILMYFLKNKLKRKVQG